MNRIHSVQDIHFEEDRLLITIDGKPIGFSLKDISRRLAEATPEQRNHFEISPSGYGIHWPLIDEDLSIDGLLGIRHRPRQAPQPA